MKTNYDVKLSEERVSAKYFELVRELNNHFKILKDNGLQIRTLRNTITELRNLKKRFVKVESKDYCVEMNGKIEPLVIEACKLYQIDLIPAARMGILTEKGLKAAIIKELDKKGQKNGQKLTEMRKGFAEKYGISLSQVKKIVYNED